MDTVNYNYNQIRNIVMQMSPSDIHRLGQEIAMHSKEEEFISNVVSEAMADYKAGRYCSAEEGWACLEEKLPWLKD